MTEDLRQESVFDVLIVGAGFSGLFALHRLREIGLRARIIEAGGGVGGTWFWNRYPGARCDVESMDYCYSFSEALQQEWHWTERYPSQPEILDYLNHVADRFKLRDGIQLHTRVTRAVYNTTTHRWTLLTDREENLEATFCIMATGCLSAPRIPDFKGIGNFKRPWYHTAAWPHDGVDFGGQTVGCIGTGSTGIQAIPVIAAQAKKLFVFQRTPHFSVPANNRRLDPRSERDMKARYSEHRRAARSSTFGVPIAGNAASALSVSAEEREREYERRWQSGGGVPFLTAYADLLVDRAANETIAEFVRAKIRSIVKDPIVAERLVPKDYPLGTKRMCIDTNYYDTFNRPNVELVDVRTSAIEEITETGVRAGTATYELDSLVFATGFDAMTGALLNVEIEGEGGVTLKQKWGSGPRCYLGIMAAGFPNMFIVTGPGSPSVLSNMVVSIEQHINWVIDCIEYLREQGYSSISAIQDAEDNWVTHVSEVANMTLFPHANSWYIGANVPGKARIFMPYLGGVGVYAETCSKIAAAGYTGFNLRKSA
jgi:cyclohexanone monooxygenase